MDLFMLATMETIVSRYFSVCRIVLTIMCGKIYSLIINFDTQLRGYFHVESKYVNLRI